MNEVRPSKRSFIKNLPTSRGKDVFDGVVIVGTRGKRSRLTWLLAMVVPTSLSLIDRL